MKEQIEEMAKEKYIREMERIGSKLPCDREDCSKCLAMNRRCKDYLYAERLYNAGYRKQKVGEWLPTCDNHPLVNKYKCSCCGEENMRGNFCPNCGASMKGGAE